MTVFERTPRAWRRRDTFPNIRAAGKVIPHGDRVQTCLQEITPRPETPPVVRKFLNSTHPEPGTIRVFFGKANDPDIASTMVHGIRTRPSIHSGPVINPPPKTCYQERLQELQEAIYSSRQKAPLGCSHVVGPSLPNGLDLEKTTFGVRLHDSFNAGELINPTKTAQQVEQEEKDCHERYIRSHSSYFVGERVNRKYDLSSYRKDSRFGVATPHRNDGHNTRKCLRWLCDAQRNHRAKLVSNRCDDFREGTPSQIGKVYNLNADTLRLPVDHTFGTLQHPDDLERKTGAATGIRTRSMVQESGAEKQAGTESLARYEDLEPVAVGRVLKSPKPLHRARADPERFVTSSSAICATVGDLAAKDYRTYGVPSVRTDLATPRIKPISDRTNYGEEGTAYELLFPTLYSLFGVDRRHFLCPRTKDEMWQIFRNAGLRIPDQTFEEAWSLTSRSHPTGEVCLESFRNLLRELQAN